jgi:hypothetical protein
MKNLLFMTLVLCFFVFIPACGNSSSSSEQKNSKRSIAIHGLYIGMERDNAKKILKNIAPDWNILEKIKYENFDACMSEKRIPYDVVCDMCEEIYGLFENPKDYYIDIFLDKTKDPMLYYVIYKYSSIDNTVDRFFFNNLATNEIFNVSQLSGSEFAQQFVNSYDIQKLVITDTGPMGDVYEYKDPRGFHIKIWNKNITFKEFTSQSEMKFQ